MHRTTIAAALLLPAGALSACSDDDSETLIVLAASSLTGVFEEIAEEFEAEHEGVEVTFSFGSSTTLAEQVAQGAPGDVLATADYDSMKLARDAGQIVDIDMFATNTLVLVVPNDNPADIHGLEDLAGSDWVRCVPEAPCGRTTDTVLADNDIDADPGSYEVDVRAVLAKVTSGEADAGLVYATDAIAAGDAVQAFRIPGANYQLVSYYLAPLNDSELATQWRYFVSSPTGHKILADAGFHFS